MSDSESRRSLTRRIKRTGLGLLGSALAASAVGAAVPAIASAAGTLTVTGTVAVPAGVDVHDVYAELLDQGGNAVAQVRVAATGTFTFNNVTAASYKVYFVDPTGADDVAPAYLGGATAFSSASSVSVTANASIGSATLTTGGEVTGTITDANTGDTDKVVSAQQVGLSDPGQVAFWSNHGGTPTGTITTSGSTETYTIGGLVPGAGYTLGYGFGSATSPSWHTNVYVAAGNTVTADAGAAAQFKPVAGAPLTESFSVPAVGSFSGIVADPGGLPNTNLNIEVFNGAGAVIPATVNFAADGTYTVYGLLPGAYRAEFLPFSQVLAPQYYNNAVTLASATPINVTSNVNAANVNVTLTGAASVAGTVTAAQGGAELGGIEVELLDAQGNLVDATVTNPDGTYTLTGVPAGTWYVRFDGGRAFNGRYYATEYYLGRPTLAGSKAIVVNSGSAVTGINQALAPEGTTAAGLPKVSGGGLSGLSTNKVALKFKLAAGTGPAGYLQSFSIKLPKNVSWNKSQLKSDIVIARDTYTYAIKSGRLVITFATGKKTVSFQIKAGGLTVTKGIQANAQKRKIKSYAIAVAATDTIGTTSSLSFTVKNPH